MNLKTRFKAALKAFINPATLQKKQQQQPAIVLQVSEPATVMDNQLLAGKNVLVTGAGRNIGRSIALEMAKQGANIYFTDIDQKKTTELEQELKKYSIKYRGFISDISKELHIDALYNSLLEHSIKIDILINNVGIQFENIGIKRLFLEEFRQTFNTNVLGPIYLTKRISEMMISSQIQGSIIFITSIHQFIPVRWLNYSASKAALGMIVEELAIDLSKNGIRVNGIAPGWVAENEEGNPFYQKYILLNNCSINPRYIGRAAVYLASEYFSKFTTGTILKIDGGMSLYTYRVDQHPPQDNDVCS
jgi:NAD(P)-dependent dehydrogenase (short-subunit alcohol dehydrogenase family)